MGLRDLETYPLKVVVVEIERGKVEAMQYLADRGQPRSYAHRAKPLDEPKS